MNKIYESFNALIEGILAECLEKTIECFDDGVSSNYHIPTCIFKTNDSQIIGGLVFSSVANTGDCGYVARPTFNKRNITFLDEYGVSDKFDYSPLFNRYAFDDKSTSNQYTRPLHISINPTEYIRLKRITPDHLQKLIFGNYGLLKYIWENSHPSRETFYRYKNLNPQNLIELYMNNEEYDFKEEYLRANKDYLDKKN